MKITGITLICVFIELLIEKRNILKLPDGGTYRSPITFKHHGIHIVIGIPPQIKSKKSPTQNYNAGYIFWTTSAPWTRAAATPICNCKSWLSESSIYNWSFLFIKCFICNDSWALVFKCSSFENYSIKEYGFNIRDIFNN